MTKFKNVTRFKISGLNQEKLLNEISKTCSLKGVDRLSKNETVFECSYFSHKKVEKILKNKNIEVLEKQHFGIVSKFKQMATSYGLVVAIILFSVFCVVQNQFIVQYEIVGTKNLSRTEIVEFIKNNFSHNKYLIDTENVEIGLVETFDQISFASCIVKGQTVVVNIKEKLMPDEMLGNFLPIIANKDGKITKIELISGTAVVKVGDYVTKGSVLVEPYTIDTSGKLMEVEAKAKISAEVYNQDSVEHYENSVEILRTGKVVEHSEITLFGLSIYNLKPEMNFEYYETEVSHVNLIENIFLPFKMKKTVYYELEKRIISSNFEEVEQEFIEKARKKALEICKNCDTIKEEYYTIRHVAGVDIINYCIVTLEEIGVTNVG